MKVEALIFDVFGTVVDWRAGVAREVAAAAKKNGIDIDASAFALAWRGKYQPAMERVRSGERGYIALDIIHRENLDAVLKDFGLTGRFSEEDCAALACAWEKLPPWPDAVPGLEALKKSHIIATCSNGSIAMMTHLAKYGGLPWDAILGAEIAKAYKPLPEVYLKSCAALQIAPAKVMMVAAHNDDLAAARELGLKTGFVKRPEEYGPGQTRDVEATSDWDIIADDLQHLAELVDG